MLGAAGGVTLQEVLYEGGRTVMLNDTECKGLFGTPENPNAEGKTSFSGERVLCRLLPQTLLKVLLCLHPSNLNHSLKSLILEDT